MLIIRYVTTFPTILTVNLDFQITTLPVDIVYNFILAKLFGRFLRYKEHESRLKIKI